MLWPKRGQLPFLCFIILIFSYYAHSKLRMEKNGMIVQVKLHKNVTEAIFEQYNDFNSSINVWASLQLLDIDTNSTCQKCLEYVFAEAFRYNTEEKNQFFYY
ncbi:hypothetical protein ACQ4LE_001988 [Meloidogyne hapla]